MAGQEPRSYRTWRFGPRNRFGMTERGNCRDRYDPGRKVPFPKPACPPPDNRVCGCHSARGGAKGFARTCGAGLVEALPAGVAVRGGGQRFDQPSGRSEEHTSELQSLMRISYAVFCLNKTNIRQHIPYPYVKNTYNVHI